MTNPNESNEALREAFNKRWPKTNIKNPESWDDEFCTIQKHEFIAGWYAAQASLHRRVMDIDLARSNLKMENESLRAQVETLKQERDEAIKDAQISNTYGMQTLDQRVSLTNQLSDLKEQNALLALQAEKYRKGLQNLLDGEYPNPRHFRGEGGGKCQHGIYYWESCENCIDEYIQSVLDSAISQEPMHTEREE